MFRSIEVSTLSVGHVVFQQLLLHRCMAVISCRGSGAIPFATIQVMRGTVDYTVMAGMEAQIQAFL